MAITQKLTTPVGDLKWVFISGQGKKNLQNKDTFVAAVEYKKDSPEALKLRAEINAFWEANKPTGAKLPKSTGMSVVKDKAGEPTDMIAVQFWTGTTMPDGATKKIRTFNAKAVEVSLGDKKIGNGSRGCISGAMSIYDQGVAARGVTLYLSAIQITKFVAYQDGSGFDAVATDDGWTGEDEDSGFTPQAEPVARPKL